MWCVWNSEPKRPGQSEDNSRVQIHNNGQFVRVHFQGSEPKGSFFQGPKSSAVERREDRMKKREMGNAVTESNLRLLEW